MAVEEQVPMSGIKIAVGSGFLMQPHGLCSLTADKIGITQTKAVSTVHLCPGATMPRLDFPLSLMTDLVSF